MPDRPAVEFDAEREAALARYFAPDDPTQEPIVPAAVAFRAGWDGAVKAANPPDLPATLATVDDVRRVCEAAGLPGDASDMGGPDYGGGSDYPWVCIADDGGELVEVEVDPAGSDITIATIHRGAPAIVLWHAIQAARGESR